MKTVYLCGGINGLSDADAKDWREEAKAALQTMFNILDPMRRDFRGQEEQNASAIVNSDKFDIKRSQIILVNAVRPSWGTAMELAYARADIHYKLIVAFNVPAKPSPWLAYHCDRMCPTLAEALEYVRGIA